MIQESLECSAIPELILVIPVYKIRDYNHMIHNIRKIIQRGNYDS